jgi:hypothetical protein
VSIVSSIVVAEPFATGQQERFLQRPSAAPYEEKEDTIGINVPSPNTHGEWFGRSVVHQI